MDFSFVKENICNNNNHNFSSLFVHDYMLHATVLFCCYYLMLNLINKEQGRDFCNNFSTFVSTAYSQTSPKQRDESVGEFDS